MATDYSYFQLKHIRTYKTEIHKRHLSLTVIRLLSGSENHFLTNFFGMIINYYIHYSFDFRFNLHLIPMIHYLQGRQIIKKNSLSIIEIINLSQKFNYIKYISNVNRIMLNIVFILYIITISNYITYSKYYYSIVMYINNLLILVVKKYNYNI